MKKRAAFLNVFILLLCLASFLFCCGCETAKGVGRDIKNADEWFREHAW